MLEVKRLIWDPANVAHIARHAVTPSEVAEACRGIHIVRTAYRGRLMVIGVTESGRTLTVVLDAAGDGVYYPVTARPASRRERGLYDEQGSDPDKTNNG